MELITTIHDIEDKALADAIRDIRPRRAARAVIIDGEKIALLQVTRDGYHKLPGGGLEGDEDPVTALRREVLEEIGCTIQDIVPIGQINDYRSQWNFYQESFCYLARVDQMGLATAMTTSEIQAGFKLVWLLSLEKAIKAIENDTPATYEGTFIQRRDLAILEEVQKLTDKSL